jgi:kynurenine formamidase
MCGPSIVAEGDKDRIAAHGAAYRQVSKSPFGDGDEIGMVNLMSPQSMREVMRRADAGKVFDLGVDYFLGMPSWTAAGDPPYQIWMSHTPQGTIADDPLKLGRAHNELVSYSGDCVQMYTHCGTHLDTLNHFGYHGKIWNGFSAHEHLGSRHWMVAGADMQPPIIARAVLFDIAGLHGVDVLPDSYGIGEDDLRAALKRQGTEFRTGDVAMIRTGRMSVWPHPAKYMADEPGLNREGAVFLARSGAILVGGDNLALEQLPTTEPDNWQVVHTFLLAEAGIPIMEVVNLEDLAAEAITEFAFLGACLRLRGATAAPMRPLAMPLSLS